MRTRTPSVPAVVLLLAGLCVVCAPPLVADDDVRLTSWAAPPYWNQEPGTPPGEEPGLEVQDAPSLDALPSQPLPFVAINPCRLADTRDGTFPGPLGPPALSAGIPRDFPVTGYCGIPTSAQAVSFNVTVTNTLGAGFILVYPTGGSAPTVSTVNYTAAQTIANAAIVPLGTDGKATFIAGVSGTDLILDVNGYYAPQTVVNTVNGLSGALTLAGSPNITVTPSGSTLTFTLGGTAGGSLTGTYPAPVIAVGAVGNTQLADDSVTAAKIVAGAVGATEIHGNAVDTTHIAPDTITAADIATGGVTTAEILDGTIVPADVAAGTYGISISGNAATATTAGTASPTGTAGGSLAGTYPNPTIGVNAVHATNILSGQVVKSLNTFKDTVTIVGGGGVTVTNASNTVTIAAPSGSMILGNPGDTTIVGQGYTEIGPSGIEFWKPTETSGAVSRQQHTAVWTGTRMLVWGGRNLTVFRNDGDAYDPATDTWSNMALTGAPVARCAHVAVWTGTVMIVWGGYDGSNYLSSGGVYDPAGTGTWTATQTTGAPTGRIRHTAVWTGSLMIVWGGLDGSNPLSDGKKYNPSGAGTWTNIAAGPTARHSHSAVWTGSLMIVWGGYDGSANVNSGSEYEPTGNTWSATSLTNAPVARSNHSAVWNGSNMIVFGGSDGTNLRSDGGRYNPTTNNWSDLPVGGAPSARAYHTAVWAPSPTSRMIVWGGFDGAGGIGGVATGASFDPSTSVWSPITTVGAPAGRIYHTMVWTGSSLIVWGGTVSSIASTDGSNTGGIWSRLSIYSKN